MVGAPLRKAVFLDRDGTINEEREYLSRVEDFSLIEGAAEAISLLGDAGFLVVVVTNQSGIGRGYYSEEDFENINRHMASELEKHGAKVNASYFCPHHPSHGKGKYKAECDCRKPLPGMLLKAAADLGIDLASSWMVGDKKSDIDAGIAAGCSSILVRTGYGEAEARLVQQDLPVADDLLAATRIILTKNSESRGL